MDRVPLSDDEYAIIESLWLIPSGERDAIERIFSTLAKGFGVTSHDYS